MTSQNAVENYIAFDQISLFDIEVSSDSTRVIQYEFEDYKISKTHLNYNDLESFKRDNYIDNKETFIKVDTISSQFELKIGDVFRLETHNYLEFQVIPQNMLKVNFEYDIEVPDAVNGCSLRFKQIKSKNFSVYLIVDCEGPSTTSLLFQNSNGVLFADAEELLWDLDSPRLHRASYIDFSAEYINPTTPYAGGFRVFEEKGKKGLIDEVTQKVYLHPEYDEIELKDVIVVKKNGKFGAIDYSLKTLLEINNKVIVTSSNNRFHTTFINSENRIGMLSWFGRIFFQKDRSLEKITDKNFDFKIEELDGYFYLRSTRKNRYKNLYLKALGSKSDYSTFFFNSKETQFSYGRLYCLFGLRKNGLYDVFGVIEYQSPAGITFKRFYDNVKDFKLIPGYPNYSSFENRPILSKASWEFPLFDSNISENRYQRIESYFRGFYRFQLSDGRQGWVDKNGVEYIDN